MSATPCPRVLPAEADTPAPRQCDGRKAYDTVTAASAALNGFRSRPRQQPPPGTVNLVARRSWLCPDCAFWHV